MEDITTATHIVTANCLYSCPLMPGMKATGTKTARSTRVVATIGPVTCPMALTVAGLGLSLRWSIIRYTFSTTTMASSTTRPMAMIRANREMVLALYPRASRTANVPISETGIVTVGTRVARQSCRKT